MKVLLTGASGFIGSHVLDCLCERNIETAILLRPTSDRTFISSRLDQVEPREGSIDDPASLDRAMAETTHVIHCAGLVKALRVNEFYAGNRDGTRNVVEAADRAGIERLVHVSSLAAAGPGTPAQPRKESDAPRPVSEYGRSKLAGEQIVRKQCQADWVIVRPPAVYGPRDGEFLRLFKAVKSHLLPDFGGGRQALSFVFVKDLARVIVGCLEHPRAAGETYFACGTEVATAAQLGRMIADELESAVIRLPLPVGLLYPVCLGQELLSRISGKPNVVNRQKYAELSAPGWVCDGSKLAQQLRLKCDTSMRDGIRQTAEWYRQAGWI